MWIVPDEKMEPHPVTETLWCIREDSSAYVVPVYYKPFAVR